MMFRTARILIFLLLVFPLLIFPPGLAAQQSYCDIARTSFAEAAALRGLAKRKEVPCKVESQEDVKRYLLDTINSKYPKEKLRNEEAVFKALGLLPEEFDYTRGLVDFYVSQIGGYYDPEKKHFVMPGWIPAIMQSTVAVHELTHALQDQHYDLEAFTKIETHTSDELLARSAIIEGDATAVMTDYARKLTGQPGIKTDKDVDGILMQNVLGFSIVAGATNMPKQLQMMLFFPYTSGLRFAHALLKRNGYRGIDEAFRNPPASTRQILHPEEYIEGKGAPLPVDVQSAAAPGVNTTEIYSDTLGEFFVSVLIGALSKDQNTGAKVASGWTGDRVVVLKEDAPRGKVLWVTRWETLRDLREFSETYGRALKERKKEGSYEFSIDEAQLTARAEFRR